MKSHLTVCGMPGIAEVPYGFHMCHLYPSPRVLLLGQMAYFLAGLQNNERCLWMVASPLSAAEVRNAIAKMSDVQLALASGQLRIVEEAEWYGNPSKLRVEVLVERLLAEETQALRDGYEGLRTSGNTSFAIREHWDRLMEYERLLHDSLYGRRILTCCSYDSDECWPVDLLEIAQCHHAVIQRVDRNWQVFMAEPDYGHALPVTPSEAVDAIDTEVAERKRA